MPMESIRMIKDGTYTSGEVFQFLQTERESSSENEDTPDNHQRKIETFPERHSKWSSREMNGRFNSQKIFYSHVLV